MLREKDWYLLGATVVGGTVLLCWVGPTSELAGLVVFYVLGTGGQWLWSWWSYGWRAKEVA